MIGLGVAFYLEIISCQENTRTEKQHFLALGEENSQDQ